MQAFNLSHQSDFDTWSKWKLSLYSSQGIERLRKVIEIDPDAPFEKAQLTKLRQNIDDFNFAFYRIINCSNFDLNALSLLGRQFGLFELDANLCAEEDRMTILTDHTSQDDSNKHRQRYIPYSNKALNWHTDGYYNPQHQRVRAFILHCVQPASSGGGNSFIDPDIVYILLRQENPAFIEALANPEVMLIPENRDDKDILRPETSTAVFQVSSDYAILDMRYSQRKKHIIWRDDSLTQQALSCLNELLGKKSKWHIDYRLKAGEGIVSNNVLHRREAYHDDTGNQRVYYRARYYSRVTIT